MPSSRFACSAMSCTPVFVSTASRKPMRFSAPHTSRAPGVNSRRSMTFCTTCVLLPLSIATLLWFFAVVLLPSAAAGSRPASLRTSSRQSQGQSTCERPKTTRDLPFGRFMASHQRTVTSAPYSQATFCSPGAVPPEARGMPTCSVASFRPRGHFTRSCTLLYSPLFSRLLSLRCSISTTAQPCEQSTVSTSWSSAGEMRPLETTEMAATFSLAPRLSSSPASGKWKSSCRSFSLAHFERSFMSAMELWSPT
mmetsp:Transcript_55360/g.177567  ORF Transcript_55360/g.177567 Transcript_55360/m.177567 type:complete len:252 (-) Transcript_55360:251-1006(-)